MTVEPTLDCMRCCGTGVVTIVRSRTSKRLPPILGYSYWDAPCSCPAGQQRAVAPGSLFGFGASR